MILLDTHIWLNWILLGEDALPGGIAEAIQSGDDLAVSGISCFEVSLLSRRGKIDLEAPVHQWLREALTGSGVTCLPVTCEIAHLSADLPDIHRDPADRIIIATSMIHDTKIASVDSIFPSYPGVSERLIGR